MIESLLLKLVIIVLLGVGAQWLAWRYKLPAIVLMSVAGLLAGPGFGVVHPEQDLGELYHPFLSIAVAIILFESSLNLSLKEIRGLGRPVLQIISIGSAFRWLFGSLAAHYIAGLSWPVSFVIAALFTVTGPTVIQPLLRQSKLKPRPAKVLKWEGTIVDPLGALLAVFAFQVVSYIFIPGSGFMALLYFFAAALFAALLGYLLGRAMIWVLRHGHIPEFFKSPALFTVVITCFGITDTIMAETGLLAVTAMGITMANTTVPAIQNMRSFHEDISLLLLSTVFIILTASITRDTLMEILNWEILGFVAIMLFVARPLAIFLSTLGTDLNIREKFLIGWIAPRGIVALALAGYFAGQLGAWDFEGATLVSSITFALVFTSVTLHGFSLSWLARKLGLAIEGRPGVLIIGSNPFTATLGQSFKKLDIPVLIIDASENRLKYAEEKEIPCEKGEFLSGKTDAIDKTPYDYIIAGTEVESYNALVAAESIEEFGRENVYKINTKERESNPSESPVRTVSGRVLFYEGTPLETLLKWLEDGYQFSKKEITEEYGNEKFKEDLRDNMLPLFVSRSSGNLDFFNEDDETTVQPGDEVIVYHPPLEKERRQEDKPMSQEVPLKE